MNMAYKNRAWILMDDSNNEIARFKSRSQLVKYWNENGNGSKAEEKEVDEAKDWLDDYEEEIDDEEEEDS